MKEFKNLKFINNANGQKEKIEALAQESARGWVVVSETIESGKFKGKKACCLYMICAPFAFCAGHTEGSINVTLSREKAES